jgi:hypothetical protein
VDAKATVKVGEFSRNGVSRVATQALDHDFQPDAQVTPVGIFLPQHDDLHLFAVTTKVTSDCLADGLETFWRGRGTAFRKWIRGSLTSTTAPSATAVEPNSWPAGSNSSRRPG